ncbi:MULTISPECIES: hypothetical protein [unclassified Shewanella]|uniref:hypothetical protein n=1 Tax=Shewanella TaxID=22 RepID=UPI000E865DCA|nr:MULTISPECIES: hypothetical protein [unclassified Shewanella]MCU8024459.1 hypothetical protein [Shewanella sp. SM78]MCU8042044.1 hypothetical protein [Shewanella sp. SM68]MCU8046907.1 hypothetical protein [Shewanella sp. SM65]MCU8081434.1 hypothetical protein [Shewanella sp. SM103]HAY96705.1 hypothetical protein [Shewanella sp.]
MIKAAYQPWFPVSRNLKPHPNLSCRLDHLSLTILWQELDNDAFTMELYFPTISGIQVIDESSYQTFLDNISDNFSDIQHHDKSNTPFPIDSDLNITNQSNVDYFSLPWPIWKSVKNARRPYYGELGEHIYQDLYSYYMVGADSVYLIDTDVEPTVNVLSCKL